MTRFFHDDTGSAKHPAFDQRQSDLTTLRKAGYQPEIDGLRAIAVLAVLFCHARFALFSGGFTGVDIFFVISGYVVTKSILKDQGRHHFVLTDFYARRLKRLMPSLYCMLLVTLLFALRFSFPDNNYDLLKNIGFVALLYSNIYLAHQTGYFDLAADKQPLLHTWSLSVEEQFYLILPALLILLQRGGLHAKFGFFSVLAVVSFLYSQHAVVHHQAESYYFLQSRACEFLIGVLLATVFHYREFAQRLVCDVALVAGLALIGWCVVMFNGSTPMPGAYALLPAAGAALVIVGARETRIGNLLLANRPAVWIGILSYNLYLWHWPVIYFFRKFGYESNASMAGALLLSLILAGLTHFFVEQPLRRKNWRSKTSFLVLFLAPVIVLSLLVVAAKKTNTFIGLYPKAMQLDDQYAGHTVFNTSRGDHCWNKVDVTSDKECVVGETASSNKAVLLGDSHAYHLIDFVDRMGKDFHFAVHDLTYTMCPPIAQVPAKAGDPGFQEHQEACVRHARETMQYVLSKPEIKTVLMSAVWQVYSDTATGTPAAPSVHGFMPNEIDRSLDQTITALEAAGKRVVMFDDIPITPTTLENCVSNRLYLPNHRQDACSYPEQFAAEGHQIAAAILEGVKKRHPRVAIVHTYDVPCDKGVCQTEIDGIPLYSHNDVGHLGAGGSAVYYSAYLKKHPAELNEMFAR